MTAVIGSANRDAAVFMNPTSSTSIEATPTQQLSFGDGIHYCIGAPLAACVAPVRLQALQRLPGLAIDGLRAVAERRPDLRGAGQPAAAFQRA